LALVALSLLLPASIPGELSPNQMTPHGSALCQACPPTEQLTAVGMLASDSSWYVNVRFAVPPLNARLRIAFQGIPGFVDVQQSGTAWGNPRSRQRDSITPTNAQQSGNQVVFAFPATLRATGVAIATASGDRIPDSGFLEPSYPAAPHFNATDAVLLLILLATALYGFKRGLLRELGDLLVIIVSLVVAGIAYKPLGALFAGLSNPRAAAILASGALVLAFALIGFLVLPVLSKPFAAMTSSLDPMFNKLGGSFTGCMRQLVVLAMLLGVGTGLSVLPWADASIHSSLLGSALIHAWQTVFAGT